MSFWKPSPTWTLAAALTACSPSNQPAAAPPPLPTASTAAPPTPATTGPFTVAVRFTHAAVDRWTAEYDLSAPVRVLGFRRPRTSRAGWHVVEPEGAKLSAGFVVAKAPFQRFVVELPTKTEQPEKDYRPFYRYSDRGLLAYTGQLGIEQASCAEGGCEDGPSPARGAVIPGVLTLKAGPGEHVVVRGQSARPEMSVALGGDDDDGTYAYFGALSPVDTPELVGVVDRAFPAWLRERMVADLPRVFALYGDRLGPLAGDARATLFLTFTALDRERGYSIGGGVLRPRVVNLDVELGRAFLSEGDPQTLADLDQLVAHEGAHLWNGDQYLHSGSEGSDWLHEGTADALALRALHAIRVLDDDAYVAKLSQAAAQCALWLSDGKPLTSSTRRGHTRAFYTCGSTVGLLADAAVKRRDPKADLLALWRAIFAEATPRYDEGLFFRVLDRLSGDPQVSAALRSLVHDPLQDPSAALRGELHRVDVETALAGAGRDKFPDDYEHHASIPAVEALLPHTCIDALVYPGNNEVTPRVSADQACPGLAKGDVIVSLAGVPLGARGATAFQRAYDACRARHLVEVVTGKKARVDVPCAPVPRQPPAYFKITKLP